MNNEPRRPRTRGLQGDRGVRVRGGRGGPAGPPPVSMEEIEIVAGSSSRGRGRRGRANARHERPGPRTIAELRICNITEMPEGRGLETPLHPKRMRMRQQSNRAPAPPASPPPPPPSLPSPSPSTSAAAPSPSCSVPSSIAFVDCDGWRSTSPPASPVQPVRSPPPCGPRHDLKDGKVAEIFNYGSDAGSDESDDEEQLVYPPIPRVFSTFMETPLDMDEDAADDPGPAADAAAGDDAAPADVPPTATDQPWRWYDFDWKEFPNSPIPPESRRETFSQINVGPTTPRDDPYDIFVDIWDRQIMEHIASETNRYAQQVASQLLDFHSLHPIGSWVDTTVDELYIYFGLLLAMGIVNSWTEEYWGSTPDIFYTPGFSAHMSCNRFLLLSKCLHFSNNNDMCALELDSSEACLFKIQPILSHLNSKFQSLYTPAQNIALDESLLMWKGWLHQLVPNEVPNRGVKTYELCESQTGYLWRFEVHAHKKDRSPPQQYEDPLEASTPSIVLRLTRGMEHKGYTLWMDNFYHSPCLARRLKSLGFDCAGTLRTDRKFVPQALHSLTKETMAKGQIAGLTSGDVDVMVWRDKNRVAMISTYHGIGQSTHRGSTKPILISDYNIMMGGVDKKDQLLAMYPIERKRTRVWYKKLFRRLLNVSVLNSFIIHNHTSNLSHSNFRIKLIKSLLSRHNSAPLPLPVITEPCHTAPSSTCSAKIANG